MHKMLIGNRSFLEIFRISKSTVSQVTVSHVKTALFKSNLLKLPEENIVLHWVIRSRNFHFV